MDPGDLILVHLTQPTEKFWGVLERLDAVGVVLRGLNVESFDDWVAQAAKDGPQMLGLVSMFVPMARVERIFADEQVGPVESYAQRFERRVGLSVEAFLGAGS